MAADGIYDIHYAVWSIRSIRSARSIRINRMSRMTAFSPGQRFGMGWALKSVGGAGRCVGGRAANGGSSNVRDWRCGAEIRGSLFSNSSYRAVMVRYKASEDESARPQHRHSVIPGQVVAGPLYVRARARSLAKVPRPAKQDTHLGPLACTPSAQGSTTGKRLMYL